MEKRGRFLSLEDSFQLHSSGELMFSHSITHSVFRKGAVFFFFFLIVVSLLYI